MLLTTIVALMIIFILKRYPHNYYFYIYGGAWLHAQHAHKSKPQQIYGQKFNFRLIYSKVTVDFYCTIYAIQIIFLLKK